MKLVKLHATSSTNEVLKLRFRESVIDQLTVVYTDNQTHGKGQHGASWQSEKGKNLTFSFLITDLALITDPFLLQKIVSVTLSEWLLEYYNVKTQIKWPNDILSVRFKIGGILIEKIYQGPIPICAIVGVGLNINQQEFNNLPKAISLSNITGKIYSLEELLISYMLFFEKELKNGFKNIDKRYLQLLFKYKKTTAFIINNEVINAVVDGIDEQGFLVLNHGDFKKVHQLKEVKWVY